MITYFDAMTMAKRCGCITCNNNLRNIKLSVEFYLRARKGMLFHWRRWALQNWKYYVARLKEDAVNLSVHSIITEAYYG